MNDKAHEILQLITEKFPSCLQNVLYCLANRMDARTKKTMSLILTKVDSKRINSDNAIDFFSWLLAIGLSNVNELVQFNPTDKISILLIAASYPGSDFTVADLKSALEIVDSSQTSINSLHLDLSSNMEQPATGLSALSAYQIIQNIYKKKS